jgi:hypothetical protein
VPRYAIVSSVQQVDQKGILKLAWPKKIVTYKFTSAIADVMMSGIGCVVSPMPSLINLACGYF